MSQRLEFEKLNNIRDLGGMTTSSGRTIRTGRLIRSGQLASATPADLVRLGELLDTVVDLRTPAERREKPDPDMAGVDSRSVPVIDSLQPGVTREESGDQEVAAEFVRAPAAAKAYMCGLYRVFVTDSRVLARYASFVRILLEDHSKAVLWHCTAGKDRAGIASVIIEEILDVRHDAIVADYLKTNDYLREDSLLLARTMKEETGVSGPEADEALSYLFSAHPSYLEAFYQEIGSRFGDSDRFLREGLGLTGDEIEGVRMRYLY